MCACEVLTTGEGSESHDGRSLHPEGLHQQRSSRHDAVGVGGTGSIRHHRFYTKKHGYTFTHKVPLIDQIKMVRMWTWVQSDWSVIFLCARWVTYLECCRLRRSDVKIWSVWSLLLPCLVNFNYVNLFSLNCGIIDSTSSASSMGRQEGFGNYLWKQTKLFFLGMGGGQRRLRGGGGGLTWRAKLSAINNQQIWSLSDVLPVIKMPLG